MSSGLCVPWGSSGDFLPYRAFPMLAPTYTPWCRTRSPATPFGIHTRLPSCRSRSGSSLALRQLDYPRPFHPKCYRWPCRREHPKRSGAGRRPSWNGTNGQSPATPPFGGFPWWLLQTFFHFVWLPPRKHFFVRRGVLFSDELSKPNIDFP